MNHNRRAFIDPDAKQLRMPDDHLAQIALPMADDHVLINGSFCKQAKAYLMPRNHHDGVVAIRVGGIRRIAPDQIRSLDSRSCGAAADHAAARKQCLDLSLNRRAEVGICQPPLAPSFDPYTRGMPQWLDEINGIGLLWVPRVQHSNVLDTKVGRKARLNPVRVDSLVSLSRWNHHEAGLRPAGQGYKAALNLRR